MLLGCKIVRGGNWLGVVSCGFGPTANYHYLKADLNLRIGSQHVEILFYYTKGNTLYSPSKSLIMEPAKQTIKIIDVKPHAVWVQFPRTGKIVKHPKRFFDKRLELGIWEVENVNFLPKKI